jgi:hypothetical protein
VRHTAGPLGAGVETQQTAFSIDNITGEPACATPCHFAHRLRWPEFMCAAAQSINALGFRNAVEAIWPDHAATVERMVKRLGMLLTWQTSAIRARRAALSNRPTCRVEAISAPYSLSQLRLRMPAYRGRPEVFGARSKRLD